MKIKPSNAWKPAFSGFLLFFFIVTLSAKEGPTPSSSYLLDSEIPVIVINTGGNNIENEPKCMASMGIVWNPGERNSTEQEYNHFNGNIGIELRGSSSLYFPKKSYGIELWTAEGADTSISIFNMPSEEDWVLNGPYSDKSLLRNVLAFHISREMGDYAPRTQVCELIINDEYMGYYVFMEKIRRNSGRVDIAKLNPWEDSGEDVTGGYILKIDKPRGGPGFDSEYEAIGDHYLEEYPIRFLYYYPRSEDISYAQQDYIQNYVGGFEDALASRDFKDPELGYRAFIDVQSFIDFMISMEISKNIDGYRISTFLHKDKNGKLAMGPVWDFNFAFGMHKGYNSFDPEGWNYKMYEYWTWEDYQFPFWWERFLMDPYYERMLGNRWCELRSTVLSTENLTDFLKNKIEEIDGAQKRNFTRWPILGLDIDPNQYIFSTYRKESVYLIEWLEDRLVWLDENMPESSTGLHDQTFQDAAIRIYPNPVMERFSVEIELTEPARIRGRILDMSGRTLAILDEQVLSAGTGTLYSEAFTGFPENTSAGLYLVEISIDQNTFYHKILKTN